MLLDQFAPQADFVARYSIDIAGSADDAYRAIWTADFGRSWLIRTLWFLRTLPDRFGQRKGLPRIDRALTLQTLLDNGFGCLAETPGREVVLGIAGQFWRPTCNLQPFSPEDFTGTLSPGMAKVVWNFSVAEGAASHPVRLQTETRVVCSDVASRHKFGLYWMLIGPFSGLIRTVMLRAISRGVARSA